MKKKIFLRILTISSLALIIILSSFILIFLFAIKNSITPVTDISIKPEAVTSFTQLNCDYLFSDKLGWSSANKDTVNLSASTDSPNTTTVDIHWQHATVVKVSDKELKVGIFTNKNSNDLNGLESGNSNWNITKETNGGFIATNNSDAMLSFSKKSGILIYSKINYSDFDVAPIAEQEAHMFSCKAAN